MKAYLLQFLLLSTSCLAFDKKLQGILRDHQKKKKKVRAHIHTQYEDTEQASESASDMAEILK